MAESSNANFLLPPSGNNLMETVANLPDLKTGLAELFHGYGLKMMFDSGSQQIKAMRENGLDMFLIPYNSLADSLQRLIFINLLLKAIIIRCYALRNRKLIPFLHIYPMSSMT